MFSKNTGTEELIVGYKEYSVLSKFIEYSINPDTKNSFIFALVQTLGKDEYLNEEYFSKDYFDYIIVDEFHHAVSNNYKKIINYFTI